MSRGSRWLLVVVFTVGATCGFLAGGGFHPPPALAPAPESHPAPAEEIDRPDSADLEYLRRELALARDQLDEARRRLGARASNAPGATSSAPPTRASGAETRLDLRASGEADALVRELVERGDIEGLWLLGAELLGQGEPGYEKALELFFWLEQHESEFRHLKKLWRQEEIFMGGFLRGVADHHEDLLRFGNWLAQKDDLPPEIQRGRDEILGEIGSVLLGFYQGDDRETLAGYTEAYRRMLVNERGSDRNRRKAVVGLSQIPTEEAARLLLDLIEAPGTSAALLREAIPALAWQNSEQALPALQKLRESTEDQGLLEVIDAAIRYLER